MVLLRWICVFILICEIREIIQSTQFYISHLVTWMARSIATKIIRENKPREWVPKNKSRNVLLVFCIIPLNKIISIRSKFFTLKIPPLSALNNSTIATVILDNSRGSYHCRYTYPWTMYIKTVKTDNLVLSCTPKNQIMVYCMT